MIEKKFTKKGFALLYSILLMSAILFIGVILMNIITKQLIFSTFYRGSETSYYYIANSLINCLNNKPAAFFETSFDLEGNPTDISPKNPSLITCYGQNFNVNMTNNPDGTYTFSSADNTDIIVGSESYKVDFQLTLNIDCLKGSFGLPSTGCDGSSLELTKKNSFTIIATGYNLPSSQSSNPRLVKRSIVSVF